MKYTILCLDVDGTLTDGKVYMGINGELMKAFNIKDGYGIRCFQKEGGIVALITGRSSAIVIQRAAELGIQELYQSIEEKEHVLEHLATKYNTSLNHIAYIGDDLNDLSAIKSAGISFMPHDGYDGLKPYVSHILTHNGGEGAVREAIDLLLNKGCESC